MGITLFEDGQTADANSVIADPKRYKADINIVGDNSLDDAIRNASALWNGRDAPASGAAGLLATARSDYRRIVAALYGAGYYGGNVSIKVDGREAANLPPDTSVGDPALVSINVDTGPLFHFGSISIENPAPTVSASISELGLTRGAIARSGAVRRAARVALDAWREQGYPKASITRQNVEADHKTNQVNVSLTLASGPFAAIGTVSVDGAVDVDADFIVRQAGLKPGQQYSPADIARARERLTALEVFGTVKIVEGDTVGPDGTLPLTILVQERKPRRIGVGTTFSTTDGLGLETFWLHRNLFGQAEQLRLDAKLTGIAFPIDTAQFDYYFGGTFTKPGVLTPDTDLIAALITQRTVLTRYTETSAEGKLGFAHEISRGFTVEAGIAAKKANFFDDLYGNRNFTVFGTYGALTYDTRDDPNNATKGVYASLAGEAFRETEYGNSALLLTAEARSYFSVLPDDRFVLAGRVKAGVLLGPSIAQTPPDKLFFAGGGGSVRGFSYRSIGVDGPGGTVTGGKFLTEASVEARVKVTDVIGVVGFVDAGYVTADNFVGLGQGSRLGVGAGLRYLTGFGPLRLDVAIPLNKRPSDPNYALYVGIGQAF